MREICTSGSVGGEGGNILAYPANEYDAVPDCAALNPGYGAYLADATASAPDRGSRRDAH